MLRNASDTRPNAGPRWLRLALAGFAALYFAMIFLDVVESGFTYAFIPGPIRFFGQVAALFPSAKTHDVDYRAEGWFCGDGMFHEIDVGAYFPILSDNKEGRFQRAMHFYHESPRVLAKLADFIVERHNARVGGTEWIGGIRLLSVVTPIPTPEQGAARYRWRPLSDFPFSDRRAWYETPGKKYRTSCRETP
jgi:hypothetical protein